MVEVVAMARRAALDLVGAFLGPCWVVTLPEILGSDIAHAPFMQRRSKITGGGDVSGEKWSLVHFKELRLTKKDLADAPGDSIAMFAITSYAVSELNVIARIMLSTFSERDKEDLINSAIFIQEACVLRFWTLKLFEFSECISDISKGKEKSSSDVRQLVKEFMKKFQVLKASESYNLARAVRNEASAHYNLRAAKKNMQFVEDSAIASLLIHRSRGNSFYPFGEEIMFAGRLNRQGASLASVDERVQLYNDLFKWCKDTNKWVHDCHTQVFRDLIRPHVAQKLVQKKVFWVDPKKVGRLSDFSIPIFSAIDQ